MRLLLFLFAAALAADAQPVLSPEVHADRRVTFRVRAPNAQKVELALETFPRREMTRGEGGLWTLTTEPLEPDIYGYTFVIDGTSFADPSNGMAKPNALSPSSAVLVPGSPPMPWEQTAVPHGTLHQHFYESRVAGDRRDYFVYTPPGWDPKKRYPLLVLCHGFSDYANGWTAVGRAHFIFDNLIARGEIRPLVVVMALGYGVPVDSVRTGVQRPPEMWKQNAAKFGEALLTEVLPAVERAYRVEKKPEKRAIAGLSMGGGEALFVGLNHLDQFGWIGAFSSGGFAGPPDEMFPKLSGKDNARIRLLWIACGKEDRLIEGNRKLVEWLKQRGVRHTWVETGGAHTWPVWRRYLVDFARLLRW
ncbi:MAG: alpha/beta hydrolase-fold protein [Bryobacteraceae bacterium]|nr:alpha/beta hydrolase-fold protein [Bryobacteraceae bacterium]MCX7604703.1 alpha/beta hydrolase-fold protein [Bryobacteraceae bacterium]